MAVQNGKEPAPPVNTTEETAAPVAACGSREVELVVGPEPHETIALAEPASGRLVRTLTPRKGTVDSMSCSPDGRTVCFSARGVVWSVPAAGLPAGGEARKIRAGDSVVADPSGRRLIVQVQEGSQLHRFSVRAISMRFRAVAAAALGIAGVLCFPPSAAGQHLVEVRGADTKYRYVDWSYTWGSGPVVDVFYVGVPGSNELDVGGGIAIRRGHLNLTPLVYAVIGREDSQRGVKIALLASYEQGGWTLLSFIGHYIPASGAVGSYQVLDTLDVTRTMGTRWEAGVQSGFFHAGSAWNPQVGPLVKLKDRLGAWAVSYRFGPQPEFRVGRVLTF